MREGSQLIIIEAASTKGSLPLVDGRLIKQLSRHVQSLFPHLRDGPFHCDGFTAAVWLLLNMEEGEENSKTKKNPDDSSPLLPSARGRDETQQKTSRDSEKISSRCSSHWPMKLDSQHPHHSLPCRSVGRIADERNPWPLIHRRTKPFTLDPLYDTTVINRPVIRGKKQCPQ